MHVTLCNWISLKKRNSTKMNNISQLWSFVMFMVVELFSCNPIEAKDPLAFDLMVYKNVNANFNILIRHNINDAIVI